MGEERVKPRESPFLTCHYIMLQCELTYTEDSKMAKFEYVIKVDGREVWKGLNPKQKFGEVKKNNPNKRVAIAWKIKEDVLVVCLR
jgi:hypothetical protein